MIFKFYKMLFLMSLMISTFIVMSSNTWMGMWMGLEINLLSFIPLMNNPKIPNMTEASIKYFITQALASTILMLAIILMSSSTLKQFNMEFSMILNSALLTKLGAAPFHFWFPEVIEGLNWLNSMILLTWQKIAPMVMLMYSVNMKMFFSITIIFSMLVSGVIGINQVSLRKILAYSSINHIGWMMSASLFFETLWSTYFVIYSIITINITMVFYQMNIFFTSQLFVLMNDSLLIKLLFVLNFFSLGGLPPFLGFFPKWTVIQSLVINDMSMMAFVMVLMTMMTLYFYTRITLGTLVMNTTEPICYFYNSKKMPWILSINFIALVGLVACTMLTNFI